MKASLPRRLEEFMEESVGGLKTSLRKVPNSIFNYTSDDTIKHRQFCAFDSRVKFSAVLQQDHTRSRFWHNYAPVGITFLAHYASVGIVLQLLKCRDIVREENRKPSGQLLQGFSPYEYTDAFRLRCLPITCQLPAILAWTSTTIKKRLKQFLCISFVSGNMHASFPPRCDMCFMDDKALDDMEELHAKRSNAGALQDDEDESRKREQEVKRWLDGQLCGGVSMRSV